jgi:hypothetical protein
MLKYWFSTVQATCPANPIKIIERRTLLGRLLELPILMPGADVRRR